MKTKKQRQRIQRERLMRLIKGNGNIIRVNQVPNDLKSIIAYTVGSGLIRTVIEPTEYAEWLVIRPYLTTADRIPPAPRLRPAPSRTRPRNYDFRLLRADLKRLARTLPNAEKSIAALNALEYEDWEGLEAVQRMDMGLD